MDYFRWGLYKLIVSDAEQVQDKCILVPRERIPSRFLAHLKLALLKINGAGLGMKISKTDEAQKQVTYTGCLETSESVSID